MCGRILLGCVNADASVNVVVVVASGSRERIQREVNVIVVRIAVALIKIVAFESKRQEMNDLIKPKPKRTIYWQMPTRRINRTIYHMPKARKRAGRALPE